MLLVYRITMQSNYLHIAANVKKKNITNTIVSAKNCLNSELIRYCRLQQKKTFAVFIFQHGSTNFTVNTCDVII